MSEMILNPYQKRADEWGLELPPILDGQSRCVLGPKEYPAQGLILNGLTHQIEPVELFLMGGIPGLYQQRGEPIDTKEWARIKSLSPMAKANTLQQHLWSIVEPAILDGLPSERSVWLEALPDVSDRVWNRAVTHLALRPDRNEQIVQAFFLTRAGNGDLSTCTKAVVTLAWAKHYDGGSIKANTKSGRPFRESLTVRYCSATLLKREIEALPPLNSAT